MDDLLPKSSTGARPSTGALLFEIRELQRAATACKFRYSQEVLPTKKASAVRAWREIHHKKAILKIVCRSCHAEKEAKAKKEQERQEEEAAAAAAAAKAQEIPKPPVLPEWLIQSAIQSALCFDASSPSNTTPALQQTPTPNGVVALSMPNPPPMPTWIMLQAAKKALRPNSPSQKQPSLPHPPPLPHWVHSMVLKETRNKLRPNSTTNHCPHNNKVTYQSPNYCLQQTQSHTKHPQPPPLPSWAHAMVLKQTKNNLRKQLASPPSSVPLSKILYLHHHFLVSTRQSLRSVGLVWIDGELEEEQEERGLSNDPLSLILPSWLTSS